MIVVADRSSFVVLVAVGHIDVLPSLFKRIVIPPEVEAELESTKRPAAVQAFIATRPSWLEVRPPTTVEHIEGLHAGEAAAIALAQAIRADRIIIDEGRGRKAATDRENQCRFSFRMNEERRRFPVQGLSRSGVRDKRADQSLTS